MAISLVLHHPDCKEHVPKAETDWEAPDRIDSVMDIILKCKATSTTTNAKSSDENIIFRDCEIQVSTDFERASLELLSRVHSAEYLTFVNDLSKELERRRKTELIKKSNERNLSGEGGGGAINDFHHPAVVPFTPMVRFIVCEEGEIIAIHTNSSKHNSVSIFL